MIGVMPEDDPAMQRLTPSVGPPSRPLPDYAPHGPRHARPDHFRSVGDERQQEPGLRIDGSNAAPPEGPRAHAHRSWQPTILLVFALICLVTGIWAIVIFPSRAPIVYPMPFRVVVVNNYPVSHIFMSISSSGQYTHMQIGGITGTLGFVDGGYIDIYVVGSIRVNCPSGVTCSSMPIQGAGIKTEQWELTVPITVSTGSAVSYLVTIDDPVFGPASNGETVTAQLPTVSTGANIPGTAPEIDFAYKVPNADTYNWSTPPTLYIGGSWADWSEQLSSSASEIPPVAITGTNDTVQSQDNRNTFISGVLLGVAGAAAIAFTQEGVHLIFDRRKKSLEGQTATTQLKPDG